MANEIRRQLAEIAHEAWSTEPFDPSRDTEDWAVADAILAKFEVVPIKQREEWPSVMDNAETPFADNH